MRIEEAIKTYCNIRPSHGFVFPTDEDGYWNINIRFINPNGRDDQTQMDVKPSDFDYGAGKCKDLVELWKEFCKENNFKQNSVTEIEIVGVW